MHQWLTVFIGGGLRVLEVLAYVLPVTSVVAGAAWAWPEKFPRFRSPGWRRLQVAVLLFPFVITVWYGGLAWWASRVYDPYFSFALIFCIALMAGAMLLSLLGLVCGMVRKRSRQSP